MPRKATELKRCMVIERRYYYYYFYYYYYYYFGAFVSGSWKATTGHCPSAKGADDSGWGHGQVQLYWIQSGQLVSTAPG